MARRLSLDFLSREVLVGLFLLFYVPIAYYFVWLLPSNIGIDYPTYYHAARLVFLNGKSPYGVHAFDGLPGWNGETVQPYLSLPPSLLVFWPLAKLHDSGARAIFLLVNQLCWLGSIWLILFRLTPTIANKRLREISLALSLVYLLSFDPVVSTLGTGNPSLIILFLVCLALSAVRWNAPSWRVALPLSAAIILKSYPALFLLPLLFRRRYRTVAATLIALGLCVAASSIVLPGHIWQSWARDMLPLTGYINTRLPLAIAWNQSLNAFVMRLFRENYFSRAPLFFPTLAKPAIVILALALVGLTCFLSWRKAKVAHSLASDDYEMAAFVCLTFLIPPLAWDHHLVYVLPAVPVIISRLVSGAVSRGMTVLLAAALFVMAWKVLLDSHNIREGWWTLLISVKMYPVLIFWCFCVVRLFRASTTGRSLHESEYA